MSEATYRPELTPDDLVLPDASSATHELQRTYYDDAKTQVHFVSAVKQGTTVKDGPDWEFRKDGRLWSVRDFSEGLLWTIHVLFAGDGKPLDHGTRTNGDGIQKAYHDNDVLRAEGPSVGGRSEGVWRYYGPDGTLLREGGFRASERAGVWKFYRNGALTQEEDYRDDGTVWVTFWDGKHKTREGLRRKDANGQWRDDGPVAHYEKGKLTETSIYHMGGFVRRIHNPEKVIKAMRSSPDWKAQRKAIDKARDHIQAYEFLEPLHATGELDPHLALSIALEAYNQAWASVAPVVFSYGQAMVPVLDAEASVLAKESYPNDNRCALLCLWRWELGGKEPLPEVYEPLLKHALAYNAELSDHKRITVEALRELLKSYPTDLRRALVIDKWGKPLSAYAGLAATPETVQQAIDEVLKLKKNVFRYNPTRAATLKSLLEETSELSVPLIVTAMQGAGKKAQARQILTEVLAKSGAPETAGTLLELVDDKVEESARAAREGLATLGEAALPAIEEALGGRSKSLKAAALDALGKLEPSDATRAVAQRRLAAEKNAELKAALEKLASGVVEAPVVEALPAGYAALLADREALAERRDAVIAELEGLPSYAHVQAYLAEKIAHDPKLAVLFAERLAAELRKDAPPVRGLDWQQVIWPLHKRGDFERVAWLAAEIATALPEKGSLNLKYLLPDLYRAARPLDARFNPIPEETPGPFPQALAFFLSRDEPVPAKKPILTWLEANAASVSAKAFAKHLDDAAKPVRDLALRGLIAAGDLAIEVTLPLLEGSTKQQQAAAEVLRAVPRKESVAPLEAAIAKEKNAKRREALESALLSCRLAAGSLDVETLDGILAGRAPASVTMPSDTPELRWVGGKPLSEGAVRWLIAALQTEDGSGPPNAELAGVRLQLEDEPAHALCRAILASNQESPTNRWVRYQRAVLGDDAAMDELGKVLGSDVYRFSADFAAHGVEVLRRHPTPAAIRWLEHWSQHSKGKLEREAEQAMRSLAAQQSRDDLVDRAMPRGDDDASRQSVTARLENAMCTARRWTPESFRELVLAHPVAAKVASNVLFACFVDDEVHPFRVVDGAPVGRDGSAFELRGGVGIPHPVELAPEVIDAWIDELAEPPFEQLDRPATANASEVLDRALPAAPIVAGELLDALEKHGFVAEAPEDAGLVYGARKRFGAAWTIRITHSAYSAGSRRPVEGSTLVVEGVSIEGVGQAPAALWSEALQAARRLLPTLA